MSLIDRLLHSSRSDNNPPEGDDKRTPREDVKPDVPPAPAMESTGDDDMSSMLRDFEDIQDAIGGDEPTGAGGEKVTIQMTVAEILNALPAGCLSGTTPADPSVPANVTVRDPYNQLKQGKVSVEVADLIRDISNDLLCDEVGNHLSDMVAVPLDRVVAAVSPEEFAKRTATQEREPAIHDMPNLFDRGECEETEEPAVPVAEPVEAPTPTEEAPSRPIAPTVPEPAVAATEAAEEEETTGELPAAGEPATPEAPEPRPEPAPEEQEGGGEPLPEPEELGQESRSEPESPKVEEPEPEESEPVAEPGPESAVLPNLPPQTPPVAEEPVQAAARQAPPPEALPPVYVAGLDINSADASEFVDAFEGVGPKLAQRIVEGRPYASQFELSRVPGLGRSLYQRITGERLPRGNVNMGDVNRILGEPGGGMPNLKAIAQAVTEMPGVGGCILSHTDGYLLAQAWKRGKAQSVGAIAPQLFKQVGKYFDLLQMNGPDSMTLFVDPRPVFITKSGDVFMIAFISRSRLSTKRLTFLEIVTSELVKRLRKGTS